MSLFSKGTTEEQKKGKVPSRVEERAAPIGEYGNAYGVLRAPIVTEKAHALATKNQYVFRISADATKASVARAVEKTYGVTTQSVRIINLPRRKRSVGRSHGYRSGVRKAVVHVREGQSIALFQGASAE
ncbi:MAG TPA: 50S ribosomal protein L23 [Patescibacteria group bacterium]|nr:50S ribosomal protein L23 [Patescibacteria group bacterium]